MTLSPQTKRYLIIGVSVYLFEVLVILVAQKLGVKPTWAVGLSFWLGLVLSFLLQKVITFEDNRFHHKVLLPQLVIYAGLVLFNFGFTILLTYLLAPPLPAVIARSGALAITTVWNFYLYKTKIFKSDPAPTVY